AGEFVMMFVPTAPVQGRGIGDFVIFFKHLEQVVSLYQYTFLGMQPSVRHFWSGSSLVTRYVLGHMMQLTAVSW
ncbi:hypothetical protein LTR22_026543, partial [Elasticomyces elasticus]